MSTDLRAAIVAANTGFIEAFARGDSEGVAGFYTEDGQILPPNGEPMSGRSAIAGFWAMVMDMGIKTADLITVEVEGMGDTAVEVGRYELGDGDGNKLDHGKYMIVWKHEGGSWKLHRDIWNSSQPAG